MRLLGRITVRPTGNPVPGPFGVAITGEVDVPDMAYIGRRILRGELERVFPSEKPSPVPVAIEKKKSTGNK